MVASFPFPSPFDKNLAEDIAYTAKLISDLSTMPVKQANQWAFNRGYQDAADWIVYLKGDLIDLARK